MFLKIKLGSLKDSIEFRCGVKALGASAALGFLILVGTSFWPVVIFLLALGAIYFSETAERKSLRISFWLLVLAGIFGAGVASLSAGLVFSAVFWFLILAFGMLIFLILGIVNSVFRHRFVIFNVLNTALAACFFMLVFYFRPDFGGGSIFSFVVWFIILFWVAGLFIKEVLTFGDPLSRGRNLRLLTWVFSLLVVELVALVAFLPLGFINAAAFLTLLYILGRDVILARLRGLLKLPLVLRELAIFAVLSIVIFATVTWVLP